MAEDPNKGIYTDAYGTVSQRQWDAYKTFNVSPSDHDMLRDYFGPGAFEEMAAAAANPEFRQANSRSFSEYLFHRWAIKHPRTPTPSAPVSKVITSSAIARCPKTSLLPAHYRADGSCRCDEHDEAVAAYETARDVFNDALDAVMDAKQRMRET